MLCMLWATAAAGTGSGRSGNMCCPDPGRRLVPSPDAFGEQEAYHACGRVVVMECGTPGVLETRHSVICRLAGVEKLGQSMGASENCRHAADAALAVGQQLRK
eukprot:jgi/Ulvmu1/5757/UM025_0011.1